MLGSGCGRSGGGPHLINDGGTASSWGLRQNVDGAELPRLNQSVSRWERGSVQRVAWANNANHGGGYAFRLCRLQSDGSVSEKCFQAGHLAFAGNTTWLQTWNDNRTAQTSVAIPRVTVSAGTFPEGSLWARVPIPACRLTGPEMAFPEGSNHSMGFKDCPGDAAGCCSDPAKAPYRNYGAPSGVDKELWWRQMACIVEANGNSEGTCHPGQLQFPEPAPGYSGYYTSYRWCGADPSTHVPEGRTCTHASTMAMIATNIVDEVLVPKSLQPGPHLLSWRWVRVPACLSLGWMLGAEDACCAGL